MDPRYKISNAPLAAPQGADLQQQAMAFAAKKALSAGINAAVPGGGIAAEAATTLLPGALGFADGGDVGVNRGSALADTLRKWWSYAKNNDNLAEGKGRWAKLSEGKEKVQHQADGGNIVGSYSPGPIGMQDMVAMAKDIGQGPLSGVKYKKSGGEVTDEVEVKFHGPKTQSTNTK